MIGSNIMFKNLAATFSLHNPKYNENTNFSAAAILKKYCEVFFKTNTDFSVLHSSPTDKSIALTVHGLNENELEKLAKILKDPARELADDESKTILDFNKYRFSTNGMIVTDQITDKSHLMMLHNGALRNVGELRPVVVDVDIANQLLREGVIEAKNIEYLISGTVSRDEKDRTKYITTLEDDEKLVRINLPKTAHAGIMNSINNLEAKDEYQKQVKEIKEKIVGDIIHSEENKKFASKFLVKATPILENKLYIQWEDPKSIQKVMDIAKKEAERQKLFEEAAKKEALKKFEEQKNDLFLADNKNQNHENNVEDKNPKVIITPSFDQVKKMVEKLVYYSNKDFDEEIVIASKSGIPHSDIEYTKLKLKLDKFNEQGGDFDSFKNNVLKQVFNFNLIESVIKDQTDLNKNRFAHYVNVSVKKNLGFLDIDIENNFGFRYPDIGKSNEISRVTELTKNIIDFLIADGINKHSNTSELTNQNISLFNNLIDTKIEENNYLMRNPVDLHINSKDLVSMWATKAAEFASLNDRKYQEKDLKEQIQANIRELKSFVENIKMEAKIDGVEIKPETLNLVDELIKSTTPKKYFGKLLELNTQDMFFDMEHEPAPQVAQQQPPQVKKSMDMDFM